MKNLFQNEFAKFIIFVFVPIAIAGLASYIITDFAFTVYFWSLLTLGLFEDEENKKYVKEAMFVYSKIFASFWIFLFLNYLWFALKHIGTNQFVQMILFPASLIVGMHIFVKVMKWFDARQTLVELDSSNVESLDKASL
jgi:hypothetical protein